MLGIPENFKGALKRDRSAGSREVAVSDASTISAAQCSQKVAHQLFSAICEAGESGKEQST